MIVFKGDYVRMIGEFVWLEIVDVHAGDSITLSDGFNTIASDNFIAEVKSADEYAAFADPILAVTDANYGVIPTGYDLVMAMRHDDPIMDGILLYGWDEVAQMTVELSGALDGEANDTVLYYVKGSAVDDSAREQLDAMEVA
tara:strand:- start:821 stop:1246 length:426 start_codon:yes stop_codon:yes gene_type:complete